MTGCQESPLLRGLLNEQQENAIMEMSRRQENPPLISLLSEQEDSIITKGCYNMYPGESRFSEDVELKKFRHPCVYAGKNITIIDSNIARLFCQGLATINRSNIDVINTIDLKQSLLKRNTSGIVDAEDTTITRIYSDSVFCRHCDVELIYADSVNLTRTKVSQVTIKQFSILDTVITGKVYFSGKELIVKDSKVNEIIVEFLANNSALCEPMICLVNSAIEKINFINTFGEAYLYENSHVEDISGGKIIYPENIGKRNNYSLENYSLIPVPLKKR